MPEDLSDAHLHCTNNRAELAASRKAGCFYCLAIFDPQVEDIEWVDAVDREQGVTALCPKCGIDSVIAEASGCAVTPAFLARMQDAWF